MRGTTHLAIGGLTGAGLAIALGLPQTMSLISAISALAPDCDRLLGLRHRGWSHSIIGTMAIALITAPLATINWWVWGYCWIGYTIGWLTDGLTPRGVAPLPIDWRLAGWVRTGSSDDTLIGLASGLLWVAIAIWPQGGGCTTTVVQVSKMRIAAYGSQLTILRQPCITLDGELTIRRDLSPPDAPDKITGDMLLKSPSVASDWWLEGWLLVVQYAQQTHQSQPLLPTWSIRLPAQGQ